MQLGVAQSGLGYVIWRGDDASECAWCAEPDIVGHDKKDVRRTLRRHHARRPPGFRLQGVFFDYAAELRVGWRELLTIDRRCGVGRARHAGRLLSRCPNAAESEKPCTKQDRGYDGSHACSLRCTFRLALSGTSRMTGFRVPTICRSAALRKPARARTARRPHRPAS